jgi:hypothetical protein
MSIFKDKAELAELIDAVAQEAATQGFSGAVTTQVDGLPIRVFRKDAPRDRPVIYLSAGIHGDEPAGPLALLELLRSGCFDQRATWLLCPVLNPSGLIAGTRENCAGIDLNRGYRNPVSAETRAHIAWLEQQGPVDLSVSLHEDYESSGFYLYEINCIDCPSHARDVLEAVSPVFPVEPETVIDGHEVREPGWIFHEPEADHREQWPEAIWMAKNGTAVSYTFETPSCQALADRVRAQVLAARCLIGNFCARRAESPRRHD